MDLGKSSEKADAALKVRARMTNRQAVLSLTKVESERSLFERRERVEKREALLLDNSQRELNSPHRSER